MQGKDWQDAMLDFSNELKQLSKHGVDCEGIELTESEIETYYKCRKMLHGWMGVYDLTFDLRFDRMKQKEYKPTRQDKSRSGNGSYWHNDTGNSNSLNFSNQFNF
jgi:hypothetical protein